MKKWDEEKVKIQEENRKKMGYSLNQNKMYNTIKGRYEEVDSEAYDRGDYFY